MLDDIAALTHQLDILDGERAFNPSSTRLNNDTYGFNASSDVSGGVYDFTKHKNAPVLTIYDAGGVDTLNVSRYHNNKVIDLRNGKEWLGCGA